MRNILKINILISIFFFTSCKVSKHSLYSNIKEVNFSRENLEGSEKIRFSYIPSFYYSTVSEINSRNGAEYRRQAFKKGFDSIVNLKYQKINISNIVPISEKSSLKNLIQADLLNLIKKIDSSNNIHNLKLPLTLKKTLDKSPANYSIAVLNDIDFTTLGKLHPDIISFQKDYVRTKHMTLYLFIINNQNKNIVYFYKSREIKGHLSKENQYELFEEEVLNFLN